MTLPCDAPAVSQDPLQHPHPSLQATGQGHKWLLVSSAPSRAGAPEIEVGVAPLLTVSTPFDDFLGQWLSTLLAHPSSLQTQRLTPSFFRISPWCGWRGGGRWLIPELMQVEKQKKECGGD